MDLLKLRIRMNTYVGNNRILMMFGDYEITNGVLRTQSWRT